MAQPDSFPTSRVNTIHEEFLHYSFHLLCPAGMRCGQQSAQHDARQHFFSALQEFSALSNVPFLFPFGMRYVRSIQSSSVKI